MSSIITTQHAIIGNFMHSATDPMLNTKPSTATSNIVLILPCSRTAKKASASRQHTAGSTITHNASHQGMRMSINTA